MARKVIAIVISLFIIVGITACAGYYQVKDPTTGNMYYTRDIDEVKGGAVVFEDAKSGTKITLQNSEVKEIDQDEFKRALMPGK
jgi:hypothetical protein